MVRYVVQEREEWMEKVKNKSKRYRYTAMLISIFVPKIVTIGWDAYDVDPVGFFFLAAALQLLAVLFGSQAVKVATNQRDKVLGIISAVYAGLWLIPDIVIFVTANVVLQSFIWGK